MGFQVNIYIYIFLVFEGHRNPKHGRKLEAKPMVIKSSKGFRMIKIVYSYIHMGVSKNIATPKWMVYNGKPYKKWMIWGYHYFWKHPHLIYTWHLFVLDLALQPCPNSNQNRGHQRVPGISPMTGDCSLGPQWLKRGVISYLANGLPNRKVVFQPSIFRGYVSFRECIFQGGLYSLEVGTPPFKKWWFTPFGRWF